MLSHTLPESVRNLVALGISRDDAHQLRRIAMTLHRWFELECGVEAGGIDRDETTGKPWWYNSRLGKRTHVVGDREAGARRRLARIMARYPHLTAYVQTDPRGASLFILTPEHVKGVRPDEIDSIYSRGVAVYK